MKPYSKLIIYLRDGDRLPFKAVEVLEDSELWIKFNYEVGLDPKTKYSAVFFKTQIAGVLYIVET